MPEIPTIQVHWPDKGKGVFQINESDFDPKVHKRLSDKEEAAAEKVAEATPKTEAKK